MTALTMRRMRRKHRNLHTRPVAVLDKDGKQVGVRREPCANYVPLRKWLRSAAYPIDVVLSPKLRQVLGA